MQRNFILDSMDKDNRILPQTVIFDDERRQVERELNKTIVRVRQAFSFLSSIEDLGSLPTIEGITPDWLVSLIHSHIKAIEDNNELISKRKEELISDWRIIQKKAQVNVNIIHSLFTSYPTAKLVFDETINNYICANKEDVINSVGAHQVSHEAQEHYNLWLAVEDAIKSLREWERGRNLKKFPLDEVLRREHTPEAFASMWVKGSFVKDRFELEQHNEQMREVYEKYYL